MYLQNWTSIIGLIGVEVDNEEGVNQLSSINSKTNDCLKIKYTTVVKEGFSYKPICIQLTTTHYVTTKRSSTCTLVT